MSLLTPIAKSPLLWMVLVAGAAVFVWSAAARTNHEAAEAAAKEDSVLFSCPAAPKDAQLAATLPATAPIDAAQPEHFETASFALG